MPVRRTRGFTLIELVTTVAILALFVLVSLPLFNTAIARQRLAGALERVAGDLRFAQAQAVTRGDIFRLRSGADAGQPGRYRLERSANGGATWTDPTPWLNLSSEYSGTTLQAIKDNNGAGNTIYEVRFSAQGAVVNGGIVTYPLQLTLVTAQGATGAIRVLRTGVINIL